MRRIFLLALVLIASSCVSIYGLRTEKAGIRFFSANNEAFRFVGRFDFSDPQTPRAWAPGAYIEVGFSGTFLEIEINDEVRYGTQHNYIEVIIDDLPPQRIQLKAEKNVLKIADDLPDGNHTLLICKNTESAIGYLEFVGISCRSVFSVAARTRKIEFIGDSITCGNGCDNSQTICGEGLWFDQHNAYLSFGPSVARELCADWQLCAVSGIGMTRSCCGNTTTMPSVYDRIDLNADGALWEPVAAAPDLVVITLGQNDGLQDSTIFCSAYVDFITGLRKKYVATKIICCASPMANTELKPVMKNYVTAIATAMQHQGDTNVFSFAYEGMYRSGCTSHPTADEHAAIAKELSPFIRTTMSW